MGIWALGDNKAVQFYSNTFHTDKSDVALTSTGEQGIFLDQGSLQVPRFNLFTANPPTDISHIWTSAFPGGPFTAMFRYYHPDPIALNNARLSPICDFDDGCAISNNFFNVDVGGVEPASIPDCIDLEEIVGGGDGDVEKCYTEGCLETQREYLEYLRGHIDGGNKAALEAELAGLPAEYSTYQSLYQKSPYLSDDILLQIAQASAMPEWRRSNLLVVNSPLSDSLMLSIDPYISDYTYQLLEAIRYYEQLSERGALESQISQEDRKKNEILCALIRQYVDADNASAIANLMSEELPEYAARTLLATYLKTGNLVQAQSFLDALPVGDDQDQQFKDVQTINLLTSRQCSICAFI